jgi:predicted unusual protein kinase regulating ubiquinone biosynthesis (AarF/ABC1/UbiB family)
MKQPYSISRIIREITVFINAFWIISSEVILYGVFRDYSSFIDHITRRLASINILYVKVFQAIASNNSLIDDKTNNELLKFTDNAPWSNSDIIYEDLLHMCSANNIVLPEGYEIPVNAGMISLVFKGYQKETNTPVIIKMKRRNIDAKLNDAIGNLETFLYLLSFIPLVHKYQLAPVINRNIDIIRRQTDFSEEVANINKIKTNCKNLKYVKIPMVYQEVTEKYPNIILMEYIDGIKINEIAEDDYEPFAKQVLKFGFVTTIVHGATHGDLHSGNILFIKDDKDEKYPHKIGVIDFGIIYELEPDYKAFVFDVLTQMFSIPPREMALKLLNSNIIEPVGILRQIPRENYENIVNFTTEIIDETVNSSKKANQIQLYKFLRQLSEYLGNSKLADIGIRPSDNMVKTQLVLAMSHGITLTLCKEDFVTVADKVINELFHTDMII